VTVYTSSAGKADSTVFAWTAGTYTVTATAGGVTGSGSYTFANSTAADARVLSATAADGIISAKVVDRFGNPVSGVDVYASRTSGTGYFGTGVSKTTTKTGTDGIAEFTLIGNAEVRFQLLTMQQLPVQTHQDKLAHLQVTSTVQLAQQLLWHSQQLLLEQLQLQQRTTVQHLLQLVFQQFQ